MKLINEDSVDGTFDGGNDTYDKVFLLSYSEMMRYFPDIKFSRELAYFHSESLLLEPSAYIEPYVKTEVIEESDLDYLQSYGFDYSQNCVGMTNCWWWLRTPSDDWAGHRILAVDPLGGLCLAGMLQTNGGIATRPAMWVSIENE